MSYRDRMSVRVVWLAAVLGCHGRPAPSPAPQFRRSTAALPAVADAVAVVSTPTTPPPVLVLLTGETNTGPKSRVRLATAASWSAIARVDPERATPIDQLEVGTLLRASRYFGWSPAQIVDAVGKPADLTAAEDARTRRIDPDEPPDPEEDGTAMVLDGPPPPRDPRSLQLAASAGFGVRGMSTRESTGWGMGTIGDLPMRMAVVAGEVVEDRRLSPKTPALVVALPATSARTLIWVLAETEGALAVVHDGQVTALRTQFVEQRSHGFGEVPWIELRVPANGTYQLEAVADTPVTLHAPSELAAALAKLRADHKLDPWNPIDILVGPDLTAQQLVDLIVAADRAGAHAIGLGSMPEGKDLSVRGHPIRDFTLRQLVIDGDVDRHPVQVALKELPLLACYEAALATHPELEGEVDVAFSIAADGSASGVTATGVDDGVDHCIAKAIAGLHVPAHGRAQAKAIFLVAPHVRLF
jgi:hypothetical protein